MSESIYRSYEYLCLFNNDLFAIVIATVRAKSVRTLVLIALRASDELRSIHLPNVGASLIASCF